MLRLNMVEKTTVMTTMISSGFKMLQTYPSQLRRYFSLIFLVTNSFSRSRYRQNSCRYCMSLFFIAFIVSPSLLKDDRAWRGAQYGIIYDYTISFGAFQQANAERCCRRHRDRSTFLLTTPGKKVKIIQKTALIQHDSFSLDI